MNFFRVEQSDADMEQIYKNIIEPNMQDLEGIQESIFSLNVFSDCLDVFIKDKPSKMAMQKEISQIVEKLEKVKESLAERNIGLIGNFASMSFIAEKQKELEEAQSKIESKIDGIVKDALVVVG